MGKYSRYRKISSRKYRFWWLLGGYSLLAAPLIAGIVFALQYFKAKKEAIIVGLLSIDPVMLCYFLIYVFVFGGLVLLLIVYWSGWDNMRFRLKQRHYRSSLMVKDYYKRRRRLKIEEIFHRFDLSSEEREMVPDKEREERVLTEMDTKARRIPIGNITYKHGKLDGIFVSYYENGNIESEVSYKEGKLEGPFRTYYSDGKSRAERFYKDGKIEDVFKAWDEDGSIFFEIHFKDGRQDGPDKTFYRHGAIQFLDIYKEGRHIHRKTYDEGGNLLFEEDFN